MGDKLKLPGNPKDVVMRFAPNPNGPLTLGHARGVVVNSEMVAKYGGKLILRFDDTDPRIKKPLLTAYDWIEKDMEWLGAKPDEIVIASDRIPVYYEHAEKLIGLGKAYVCECEREEFKSRKAQGQVCACRESEESLDGWKQMIEGKFEEGETVLRIKTDMHHPNPALRDWVAFRIIKEDHPRVGGKYVVWPMLDFESAIEDHLLGITHIIRGKDLSDSEKKQGFVYGYLGWDYPSVIHWGRLAIHEYGKFSTSEMSKAIAEGRYSGWDDPSLPTLRSLKRRGIQAAAIRTLMTDLGLSLSDITVSLENLYAENRKLIDGTSNRYFYVEDPVKVTVKNSPCKTFRMPLHPVHRGRGVREYALSNKNGEAEVFISNDDACKLEKGDVLRLIGYCAVEVESVEGNPVCKTSNEKTKGKIQWIQDGVNCKIAKPEGTTHGLCEKKCTELKVGDVIQFERYGFVKLDEKKEGELVFYYAHR